MLLPSPSTSSTPLMDNQTRKHRIAGACLNQTPMDWKNNLSNINQAIAEAKDNQVELLCLPELCITGYGCEDMFHSPWLAEKAWKKLTNDILPATTGIAVAIGLPYRHGGHLYNCVALLEDSQILGIYAKQKLANDGVHYEPRWFQPWNTGDALTEQRNGLSFPFGHITIHWKDIHIGFEICEDAWRKDRPGCHPVNKGVDLFLNPSASHFAFEKAKFREKLVLESSKLLNCAYLYCNLLGNEAGRMTYDGDILFAQLGTLKTRNKRLSFLDHKVLHMDVDFDDHKETSKQVQEDYQSIYEEFTQAEALALTDYLRKSHSQGFVLSLSGGADSSSIAVLVAESVRRGSEELGMTRYLQKIGKEASSAETAASVMQSLLYTAYQGTENSSSDTFQSAQKLAESIGSTFYSWTIDEEVASYRASVEKALQRKLTWQQDDIALQNIQARARSPIIWMVANIQKCLLLSTSNRSEGDVGYATMDGDTSGSISPIAAVDKHFILGWLVYAQNTLGYDGLKYVNALTPTAELRPLGSHQTDEKDLMPYAVLVEIEVLAIRDKLSPLAVFKALQVDHDPKDLKVWISKFFRLWSINQWKRERIAPSFHMDDFNVDPRTWCRFPILSSGFTEELEELRLLPV